MARGGEAGGVDAFVGAQAQAAFDQRVTDRAAAVECRFGGAGDPKLARHRCGHANLGPGAPVQRHRETPVACATRMGIGVKEGVRRSVVDLASQARERTDRREQHREVERHAGERRLQYQRALQLGREHGGGGGRVFQLHHAVVDDAGGVQHTVDRAEARAGLADHCLHLRKVGHVGRGKHHFGTVRFECAHLADALRRVAAVGLGQHSGPLRTRRQRSPAKQHQARLATSGQVLGHRQADPAEAAGDQVNTLRTQALDRRGRLVEARGLVVKHPTIASAPGDGLGSIARGQFGSDVRDCTLELP